MCVDWTRLRGTIQDEKSIWAKNLAQINLTGTESKMDNGHITSTLAHSNELYLDSYHFYEAAAKLDRRYHR